MRNLIFVLIVVILIISILFALIGLIWALYKTYENILKPIIIKIRLSLIKRKINFISGLPDDEKTNHVNEIQKLNNYVTSVSSQKEGLGKNDIEMTSEVKNIIDNMITAEVYSVLRTCISLNTKYNITNIDTDIEKVSSTVFNGLNPKLLNTDLVFSDTYIMNYIIGQSYNLLLKVVIDHNISIL